MRVTVHKTEDPRVVEIRDEKDRVIMSAAKPARPSTAVDAEAAIEKLTDLATALRGWRQIAEEIGVGPNHDDLCGLTQLADDALTLLRSPR